MLKLNVGLSRKIGEANYSLRGASVNLELEVESALATDPANLQDRIRQLFRLARSSVDEELAAPPAGHYDGSPQRNGHTRRDNFARDNHNGNGRHAEGPVNGDHRGGRLATASQVKALHAICRRQRIDLLEELRGRYGVDRPEDLGIGQASELIDAIKPPSSNGDRR